MVHDIRYTRVQRNIIILNKPTARRTHVRVIYSRKSRVGALRGPLEINLRQRSTFFNTQDFSITLSVVVPTWISHTRFQKLAKTIDIRSENVSKCSRPPCSETASATRAIRFVILTKTRVVNNQLLLTYYAKKKKLYVWRLGDGFFLST